MTSETKQGRRGQSLAAAAAALVFAIGAVVAVAGTHSRGGPPQPSFDAGGAPRGTAGQDASPPALRTRPHQHVTRSKSSQRRPDFGPILPGSEPVALDIPSIDLHSTHIVDLARDEDGAIEVPADPSAPGWYTPGPSPGQLGPAVIAGHVDSVNGPAVFYRLGELRPGDLVRVSREDRSVATFAIDRVDVFEKDSFPTTQVYGTTTSRAELRLITCGGTYDKHAGYLSNVVAFGHLVSAT